jgi:hypothetical protein
MTALREVLLNWERHYVNRPARYSALFRYSRGADFARAAQCLRERAPSWR